MSLELNAQIARESIEAPLREDWDRLRELYAQDAVMTGTPEPVHGPEAIVEFWQGVYVQGRSRATRRDY